MSELKSFYLPFTMHEVYFKSDVDAAIAELKAILDEKDAEIARLKGRCLDVKDAAHVLKAFKFYLCQLTHCAYDERTAQWIIDNWYTDYNRVEGIPQANQDEPQLPPLIYHDHTKTRLSGRKR